MFTSPSTIKEIQSKSPTKFSQSEILSRLSEMKKATLALRRLPSKKKNAVLKKAAQLLFSRQDEILSANRLDLADVAEPKGSASLANKNLKRKETPAFRDRLTLNPKRISQMVESLKAVAKLPDPVGEVLEQNRLQNGLLLKRVRSPLGVILMIFESRPNVAIEAFSLAFKAGNAVVLRGGKESRQTVGVLYQILKEALVSEGIPEMALWGVTSSDRNLVSFLLKQKKWIDVVVPRGGDSLIEFVTEESRIPIIKNDRGLCHVYVHQDADLAMARKIILNAKTQRPGVCNAIETILVHQRIAEKLLPSLYVEMKDHSVRWNLCSVSYSILDRFQRSAGSAVFSGGLKRALSSSWDTEYLDLEMNCRVVESLEEAISHIETHGSKHSESIITESAKVASQFQNEVDCAVAYWNASTRFTDGFQFGLGGELGISTQKLHVRGPVGLRELTSVRWVVDGNGQVRGE